MCAHDSYTQSIYCMLLQGLLAWALLRSFLVFLMFKRKFTSVWFLSGTFHGMSVNATDLTIYTPLFYSLEEVPGSVFRRM